MTYARFWRFRPYKAGVAATQSQAGFFGGLRGGGEGAPWDASK
jgi:hypothetical protein